MKITYLKNAKTSSRGTLNFYHDEKSLQKFIQQFNHPPSCHDGRNGGLYIVNGLETIWIEAKKQDQQNFFNKEHQFNALQWCPLCSCYKISSLLSIKINSCQNTHWVLICVEQYLQSSYNQSNEKLWSLNILWINERSQGIFNWAIGCNERWTITKNKSRFHPKEFLGITSNKMVCVHPLDLNVAPNRNTLSLIVCQWTTM